MVWNLLEVQHQFWPTPHKTHWKALDFETQHQGPSSWDFLLLCFLLITVCCLVEHAPSSPYKIQGWDFWRWLVRVCNKEPWCMPWVARATVKGILQLKRHGTLVGFHQATRVLRKSIAREKPSTLQNGLIGPSLACSGFDWEDKNW